MEDPLLREKGACMAVILMGMTSLESTEQKLPPTVCDVIHAYLSNSTQFIVFFKRSYVPVHSQKQLTIHYQ